MQALDLKKTISLFNLISQQPDIDKIYLYGKNLNKARYQILTGLKDFHDSKAFFEYLNDMDDIYKNIEEFNPNEKRKILIFFCDTNADMLSHKRCNPTGTELFKRGRKLNISLVFIKQSYFAVPKSFTLSSTHYFILKNSKKTRNSTNYISLFIRY